MAANATLRLLERPQLQEHRIQYSDALHLLIIDETVIPCTPTEYSLLQTLLQHAGEGVSIKTSLHGTSGHIARFRVTTTSYPQLFHMSYT